LIRTTLAPGDVVDGREWTRPGWWPPVREWIGAQLGDVDIVQVRTWESSCVARVQRRAGDRRTFFFKALPTSGVREPRVSDYLSRRSAPGAPHLHATDLGRRWLLIHASRGVSLDHVRDPRWWERGVATYGRLQAATIGHCDHVRALGCAERRLEDLVAAIEPLLTDTQAGRAVASHRPAEFPHSPRRTKARRPAASVGGRRRRGGDRGLRHFEARMETTSGFSAVRLPRSDDSRSSRVCGSLNPA
jgi:hypothetical protein